MKILIYGSKGWIGSQFVQVCKDNEINFISGKARVDNEEDLRKEIENVKPTHIVSFIGRTSGKIGDKVFGTIDYLEQEGKLVENVRDNLFSPLMLALLSKEKNIHFSYLGTGCIFSYDEEHKYGKEENGFRENSKPNFVGSSYSTVKGFTDRIMHQFEKNVLNVRIRMPITGEMNARNFITKITTYEKICSIPNSMTVLPELLPILLDMMKKKVTGTINFTNPGLISHNEILTMFKEIVDPNFEWSNFSIEEQSKILASARSNNYLDTSRLEKLYPNVLPIKEAVKNCLLQYKKTYVPKKKINLLVTGGCGFIGSNFINKVWETNKYKIINLDAMYYCAKEENILEPIRNSKDYVLCKGNLCNEEVITYILHKYNINQVIHFAAQSHVQNSFKNSLQFTDDNVKGTHVLLEAVRKYKKVNRFIHVSTDEVYGESLLDKDETIKTEESLLNPTNPYSATKAGAELIAKSYIHSYKMPIIITRGNNVYGPNQYPEKLIPKFIQLLKEGKKVTIQGNGKNVRAFLHAYDTADAFITILEKGKIGEIYNIGCDEGMEYSILEVAKLLIKLIKNTDKFEEWIEWVEDRPHNDLRYFISNQKVKDLGWTIKIKFEEGIKKLLL